MNSPPISKKTIILTVVFSFCVCLPIFLNFYFDERTKIVFCTVGQGDATYIRINNKIDVLIDAGPDKSVLSCLGKFMPFWDKEIEFAFLSHPNDDHYNGYFFIADRYKIDHFITVKSSIVSKTYIRLMTIISTKKIPFLYSVSGDKFKVGDGQFISYWPPIDFKSYNDNDFSQILLFKERGFNVLFTGDASPFILDRLSHKSLPRINVLKIPHHGSKNGLTKHFLGLADPGIAVISVGKNNPYNHPNQDILDMLKAKNIKIRRTDEEGNIVFRF
jgi:competence protein ComEC